MTYKLPYEKKKNRGKISKGKPFGRILRGVYDPQTDRVLRLHATKGYVSFSRAALYGRPY